MAGLLRLAPRWSVLAALLAFLSACSAPPPASALRWQAPGAPEFIAFTNAPLLLLGEQHDAPEHHRIEADLVQWLSDQRRLRALVLEMADEGRNTIGLSALASETQVQEALGWAASGWPWADYRQAIMAAVRARVPVLGANLPRQALRDAMANTALDAKLDAPALALQDQRMVDGHCGLLPASQTRPMTRVQIARDLQMAQTMTAAHTLAQGDTAGDAVVLLLAGQGHVDKTAGVPVHLARLSPLPTRVLRLQSGTNSDAAGIQADLVWHTPALPSTDHCARLRNR